MKKQNPGMNEKELKFILQEGEGQFIEFKENINGIDKDMVAFANSNKGRILLGVDDKSLAEKPAEKLGGKLGGNQIKIIELINKNSSISILELSKKMGISTTAIENNLAKLKKIGLLKRIGPAKGGYWEVAEK